jgi:TorA maturation chaperone TorD
MMLPAEEAARASFYGLLARLFHAPPDAALLEALAGAGALEADEGAIGAAWQALVQAAAAAECETERETYESAFIGTGKAPVSLYTTAYTLRYSNEVPLAGLRTDLAALGLWRHESRHEPEDHIAALCDMMRHAIRAPHCSNFYERVARFARAFFELERSAFEMSGMGTPPLQSASHVEDDFASTPRTRRSLNP